MMRFLVGRASIAGIFFLIIPPPPHEPATIEMVETPLVQISAIAMDGSVRLLKARVLKQSFLVEQHLEPFRFLFVLKLRSTE